MTVPDRRIELRPLTRAQIAVLVGVPLAWAALLWFHPDVDPDRVYESLRDQVDTYLVVHVGTLVTHPNCSVSFDLVPKVRVEG